MHTINRQRQLLDGDIVTRKMDVKLFLECKVVFKKYTKKKNLYENIYNYF